MKKTVYLLIALTLSTQLMAQNGDQFNPGIDVLEKPSVEAWQMMKYGNNQHSLNTGTISYSQPLYTYKDEDFTLPLSLEYSFEGYRPAIHSGTVGLGWHLQCGGVITRDINGLADETNWSDGWDHGYFYTVTHTPGDKTLVTNKYGDRFGLCTKFTETNIELHTDIPQYWFRGEGFRSRFDVNPDLFHFTFLGHHGDFMMLQDGSFQVFNTDLPFGTVQIQVELLSNIRRCYAAFTINTGDGYTYRFEPCGWSHSAQILPGDDNDPIISPGGDEHSGYTAYTMDINSALLEGLRYHDGEYPNGDDLFSQRETVTQWNLKQITAPNGNSVIFNYKQNNGTDISVSISYSPAYEYIEYAQYSTGPHSFNYHNANAVETRVLSTQIDLPLESVIVNGKEILHLVYSEKKKMESIESCFCKIPNGIIYQEDLPVSATLGKEQCLNQIIMKDRKGSTLGTVGLNYTYTQGNGGAPRMLLESVNSSFDGLFRYDYNVDSTFVFPYNDTEATDYWGFWNGESYSNFRQYLQTDGMQVVDLYNQVTSGKKNPNYSYAIKGAVTRINYPSGGNTVITYEPHSAARLLFRDGTSFPQLKENTGQFSIGGIRVKKIEDCVPGKRMSSREYSYCDSLNRSSGMLMQMPRYLIPTDIHVTSLSLGEDFTYNYNLAIYALFYSSATTGVLSSDAHITYSKVREHFDDHSVREYIFTDYNDYPDMFTGGQHITKKLPQEITFATFITDSLASAMDYLNAPPCIDRQMMRGKIKQITTYKDTPSGLKPIRMEKTFYDIVNHTSVDLYYNTIGCFSKIPFFIQSPTIIRTETEEWDSHDNARSILLRTQKTYNSYGQIASEKQTDLNGNGHGLYYKYCHESSEDGFPASISDVAETAIRDSCEYYVRRNKMLYDGINPNPYQIVQYAANPVPTPVGNNLFLMTGLSHTYNLTYNELFRTTRVSSLNSGYNKYIWDGAGDYLVSLEKNAPENTTTFDWKDLVGVTRVTEPTGQETRYDYDAKNRLAVERDAQNQVRFRFFYHLNNE